MSKETHVLPKQEILLGRAPGGEQWGEEAEEDCSATRLAVSGFMMMVLVFRLPLANQSDSLSQDGYRQEGFWEVVGHVVSPFDLAQTLPLGGGLLVPCSLSGPPIVKQLMQMVTRVPGQGGWFQLVCFP